MQRKRQILAMSILVRDEADLLANTIRFHHKYGVDAFVIGDNGSTDGSRAIVKELARTIPIHIVDFPAEQYRQSRWMTEMARIARRKFNARWVINNDADEFWLPQSDNIKNHLRLEDTVVEVVRSNMLVPPASKNYYLSSWRVSSPIGYSIGYQQTLGKMSLLLVSIKPNVIVNPRGLIRIKGGNHSASHLLRWGKPRQEKGIHIYHFPIRTYAQFLKEVQRMAELLAQDPESKRIGQHRRRWAQLLKAGKLKKEYDDFFLSPKELQLLEKLGIIVRDERISQAFAKLAS